MADFAQLLSLESRTLEKAVGSIPELTVFLGGVFLYSASLGLQTHKVLLATLN